MRARAATLTDAAGCCLASWLGLGCKSINPGLVSAVFGEMMMELGGNSSLRQGEWQLPTG